MATKGMLETQDQLSSNYSGEATKRWLNRITSNPDWVVDLLLIAFVVTYSLVGMRNFDLRMATLHEDDGPIFYAHAFRSLSLFEGDFPIGFPLSQLVPVKVVTSAMVWMPAWRIAEAIKRTTLDLPRVPLTSTLTFILLRLRQQRTYSLPK